jgi:predicted amidophosphoribosyltransferase
VRAVGLRAALDDLLDAVLPARCAGCGRSGQWVCASCARTLEPAGVTAPPAPVDWWTACFAYAGLARELVARAKYRNERRFLVVVARELASRVATAPCAGDPLTRPPPSAARLRAYGIDHAEVLARAVAREVGAVPVACLQRAAGPAQTGLDARTRRLGPRLRGVPGTEAAVADRTVLVVDDVATTGGTLAAAARAVRAHGAARVLAATIARTPPPGSARGAAAYTPEPPFVASRPNPMEHPWTSSSPANA